MAENQNLIGGENQLSSALGWQEISNYRWGEEIENEGHSDAHPALDFWSSSAVIPTAPLPGIGMVMDAVSLDDSTQSPFVVD
jgi:hypothetical protein